MLQLEAVYELTRGGTMNLQKRPPPSDKDMEDLVSSISTRVSNAEDEEANSGCKPIKKEFKSLKHKIALKLKN